jgi:hypothetical protein
MLTVAPRRKKVFRCPRHIRQSYVPQATLPPSCPACEAIAAVELAERALDQAERKATEWIARTGPVRALENAG